ncbi:MAG: phage holin family protein [Smithellaceae bacterium]
MIVIITRWLIITGAIMLSSVLIPGIRIDSFSTAVIAAGLLGIINIFIKPVLIILTLPLNIVTLGLFSFIINAFLLKLVAYFVTGFEVDGFLAALLGALVISLVNWLSNRFIVPGKIKPNRPDPPDYIDLEQKGNGKWE